jgi:hypothetical protein
MPTLERSQVGLSSGESTHYSRQKRKFGATPACAWVPVGSGGEAEGMPGAWPAQSAPVKSAVRWIAPACSLMCRSCRWSGLHLSWSGCAWQGWQRYSRKVQQQVRTQVAAQGRVRTVTCTDGRGWTCCRQMACKRSAVRARLAPLQVRGPSPGRGKGPSSFLCRSKIGFWLDLGLPGFQAARSYSLIRPLRTGFRRTCHVLGRLR